MIQLMQNGADREEIQFFTTLFAAEFQKDGRLLLNKNFQVTGVSTFTGAIDANGDLDVDGHTNLDNVSIAGVVTATTFKGALEATSASFSSHIDANGDLDVDGHTNLDNVSVAGVTTFSGDVYANEGIFLPDTKALKIGNTEGTPDFTISHDTSNTILDNNTGCLLYTSDAADDC